MFNRDVSADQLRRKLGDLALSTIACLFIVAALVWLGPALDKF